MVKKSIKKVPPRKIKGVIVFYWNVGTIPTKEIEPFFENLKSKIVDVTNDLKASDYDVVWIPNRGGLNRIELLPL